VGRGDEEVWTLVFVVDVVTWVEEKTWRSVGVASACEKEKWSGFSDFLT
jgi:hypothetical protein